MHGRLLHNYGRATCYFNDDTRFAKLGLTLSPESLTPCTRGGTEPEFSKLNRARAFTSRARAELRAHISNIFRARAELRAQIFRAEPSLTIIEPSPSRAFEPEKWKFFQFLENF